MRTYKTVKALLFDPKRWGQGAMGLDSQDMFTSVFDPSVVKFCLLGAIARVDGPQEQANETAVALAVRKLFPNRVETYMKDREAIFTFNDHDFTTHADIKAVLKEANV